MTSSSVDSAAGGHDPSRHRPRMSTVLSSTQQVALLAARAVRRWPLSTHDPPPMSRVRPRGARGAAAGDRWWRGAPWATAHFLCAARPASLPYTHQIRTGSAAASRFWQRNRRPSNASGRAGPRAGRRMEWIKRAGPTTTHANSCVRSWRWNGAGGRLLRSRPGGPALPLPPISQPCGTCCWGGESSVTGARRLPPSHKGRGAYGCHPFCSHGGEREGLVRRLMLPLAHRGNWMVWPWHRVMEEGGVVGDRRPTATGRGAGLAVRRRHLIAQPHKRGFESAWQDGACCDRRSFRAPFYRARRDPPLGARGRHQGPTSL